MGITSGYKKACSFGLMFGCGVIAYSVPALAGPIPPVISTVAPISDTQPATSITQALRPDATRAPLIAFSWATTSPANSYIKPMFIPRHDLTSPDVVADALQFFANRAPGERGMLLYTDAMISNYLRSYSGNACRTTTGQLLPPSMQCPWLDAGAAVLKKRMDIFFKNLSAGGVKLDRVALNVEAYQLDSWGTALTGGMNNDPQRYLAVLNDPRFYRESTNFPIGHALRRSVAASLGFDDLSLIINSHQIGWNGPLFYSIWNSYMSARVAAYTHEAVAVPALRYFPNIQISDNPRQLTGSYFLPDENGAHTNDCSNPNFYCGHGDYVGTHQDPTLGYSPRLRSAFAGGSVSFDGIRNFGADLFSALKYSVNKIAIGRSSNPNIPLTPTIACRSYAHHQSVEQAMYPEHVLHALLSGVDNINYWNPNTQTFTINNAACDLPELDDQTLNSILSEFNQFLGYSNRRPLRSTPVDWYSDYVLSGMEAGGNRLYRFTPGQHQGIQGAQAPLTLAGTIVSTSPLTLVTPQARLVFPGGHIWTPANPVSNLGIWIIQSANDPLPSVSDDGVNSPPIIDFKVIQIRQSGAILLSAANTFDEDGYVDHVEWDAPWNGVVDFAFSHSHPFFRSIQLPADYFSSSGIQHVAFAAYDNLGRRSCARASFYMPASPCLGFPEGESCELSFGIGSGEAC